MKDTLIALLEPVEKNYPPSDEKDRFLKSLFVFYAHENTAARAVLEGTTFTQLYRENLQRYEPVLSAPSYQAPPKESKGLVQDLVDCLGDSRIETLSKRDALFSPVLGGLLLPSVNAASGEISEEHTRRDILLFGLAGAIGGGVLGFIGFNFVSKRNLSMLYQNAQYLDTVYARVSI